MWCNGFLEILEIYPAGRWLGGLSGHSFCRVLRRFNPFSTPPITRIVAQQSGNWIIETEPGERLEVRLISGWIIGSGLSIGLCWKSSDGRCFRSWLTSWRQDPVAWRRLQVRLRMPV
jgi:hypothetical protein